MKDKQCTKCLKVKDEDRYYNNSKKPGTKLSHCKQCCRDRTIEYRKANLEKCREMDRRMSLDPKRREARKDYRAEVHLSDPRIRKAHGDLNYAIKVGSIERGPCEVCGTTSNIHGHHDNYNLPLDVRWLCHSHHRAYHAELTRLGREAC